MGSQNPAAGPVWDGYRWGGAASDFGSCFFSCVSSLTFVKLFCIYQINYSVHSTVLSFNRRRHFSSEESNTGPHFLLGGTVAAALCSTHWLGIIDVLSQASSGHERRHSSPQWTQCVSRGLQTWIGPAKCITVTRQPVINANKMKGPYQKRQTQTWAASEQKRWGPLLAEVHVFVCPFCCSPYCMCVSM